MQFSRTGYWRKANAIHKWFEDRLYANKEKMDYNNIPVYIPFQRLLVLKKTCQEILAPPLQDDRLKLAKEKLSVYKGYFFGSYLYDEVYFDHLKYTIQIIDNLDPLGDYYYRASW